MFKYLICFLFLMSCGYNSPKFKVGDCTVSKRQLKKSNEFLNNQFDVEKILKVGERNYLFETGKYIRFEMEFPIEDFDSIMTKIDCPEELK